MISILVFFRLIGFVLASAFFYLLLIVGRLAFVWWPALRRAWRKTCMNAWARTLLLILGVCLEISGPPPRPPFFLVANHLSYIDIIVLASFLDCVFVSRSDVAGWPGIGLLARSVGTIFLDREKNQDIPRAIKLINKRLDERLGVVVFPEGTSTRGDRVYPFKPSLLEPAARASYPVSYAAISYRTRPEDPPAGQVVSWWGEMSFAPHLLSLLKLRGFDAFVTFGDHSIQADDRKVLANNLWSAVTDCFVPMAHSRTLDHREKL